MKMLKACYDWRVIAAVAAVGIGILVFAPSIFAFAAPLLFLAICPLSMLLMMKMMGSQQHGEPGALPAPSADRAAVLRARLASTRVEQERLARELEAIEAEEVVVPHGTQAVSARR